MSASPRFTLRKHRISEAARAELRRRMSRDGYERTAEALGSSAETVKELASGGFAMQHVAERLERALVGKPSP